MLCLFKLQEAINLIYIGFVFITVIMLLLILMTLFPLKIALKYTAIHLILH